MRFCPLSTLTVLTLCLATPVRAENLDHTQRLIGTKQCQRCDLSGAGLIYADLAGADLDAANLSQANLSRVNLSNANLQQANLAGAVLVSANLSGANLSGANLNGADLRGAILSGAKLQGASLDGANFLGAIGLPSQVATPENLYMWGLQEAQRGDYRGAIGNFNQAIGLKPDFAHAYLARGIARLQLSDQTGAVQDAQRADQFYVAQGDQQGHQAATQFTQGIQEAQKASEEAERASRKQGGNGVGTSILSVLGSIAGMALQSLQYLLPVIK